MQYSTALSIQRRSVKMEKLEYTQDIVRNKKKCLFAHKAKSTWDGLSPYWHFKLFLLSAILLKSENLYPPSLL